MTTQQRNQLLRELKLELQKLYGDQLVALILYGSYARGEAHEDSDLDVAMVLKNYERPYLEITRTGEITARLALDYDQLIALIPFREKDWREKQGPFFANLREEGVEIQ